MSDNPIRKRRRRSHFGYWRTVWFGVCPDCGDEVPAGTAPHDRSTRKTAKDGLHRHRKHHHTASPVG